MSLASFKISKIVLADDLWYQNRQISQTSPRSGLYYVIYHKFGTSKSDTIFVVYIDINQYLNHGI